MTTPRPASTTPPVPGTITALRVLLGLSAAGNVMAVLMALVVAAVASSFASTLTPGLDDDTSITMQGLGSALLVLALLVAVFTAVELWAVVAIAARRRAARTAITAVQVADLLVAPVVVAAVGVEALVPMLLAMPFGVTMLVLAWVPAGLPALVRRHACPRRRRRRPHRRPPHPGPAPSGTPMTTLSAASPAWSGNRASRPDEGEARPWCGITRYLRRRGHDPAAE